MEKFGSIYNLIKEIEKIKKKKLMDIKYKTKSGKERRISKCIENIYKYLYIRKKKSNVSKL